MNQTQVDLQLTGTLHGLEFDFKVVGNVRFNSPLLFGGKPFSFSQTTKPTTFSDKPITSTRSLFSLAEWKCPACETNNRATTTSCSSCLSTKPRTKPLTTFPLEEEKEEEGEIPKFFFGRRGEADEDETHNTGE